MVRTLALEGLVLTGGVVLLLMLQRRVAGKAQRMLAAAGALIFLACAYLWLAPIAMYFAFQWHRPLWWEALFESGSMAALTWLQIPHMLALVVSALPIACCITWMSRQRAFALGLLVAALAMISAEVPVLVARARGALPALSGVQALIMMVDMTKLFLALPLMTLLVLRLRSGRAVPVNL